MLNSAAEEEILRCNRTAMTCLHAEKAAEALSLLQKARKLLKNVRKSQEQRKLKVVTLNNLGCFYKRQKQPKAALGLLEAALRTDVGDSVKIAGTHLNICAIKSQLGDHQSALSHAQTALALLTPAATSTDCNVYVSQALAYHSMGVEYECLRLHFDAAEAYLRGLELAKEKLGAEDAVTKALICRYMHVTGLGTRVRNSKPGRIPSVSPEKSPRTTFPRTAKHARLFAESPPLRRYKTASRVRTFTPALRNFPCATPSTVLRPPTKLLTQCNFTQRDCARSPVGKESQLRGNFCIPESSNSGFTLGRTTPSRDRLMPVHVTKTERKAQEVIQELERLKREVTEQRLSSACPHATTRKPFLRWSPQRFPASFKSLVCIQSAVRGYIARREKLRIQRAAVCIQRRIRGFFVRVLYERIRDAVVYIQRRWRLYRSLLREGG